MLCQLCSSLDLAAIMQLRLEPDFSPVFFTRDELNPKKLTNLSNCEALNNLIQFSLYDHDKESCKYEDYFVPYHKTLEDLYQASKECGLCYALLQSAAGMIEVREAIDDSECVQGPSGEGLFLCGLGNGQGVQLMALDPDSFYALLGGVGFTVDNGSALESIIYGRTIPKSPRSKDSLSSVRKWLSTCSAQHKHHISHTPKPSRLLKYDQNRDKVSLCTSFPPAIEYAALSHCWGSVQPLTLNNGTKHELEDGLPLDTFPKTFQDAFWVIQQLNIPYLWIDSLCIFQDDHDDWVHESARMCHVYGNAYLTIAADRAMDCSEGFLGITEGPDYTYVPINLDGVQGNVAIFQMPLTRVNPLNGIIDLEEEPLSKRCWALQERYLSTRTLHFASTQMYFECRSGFYPQDRHLEHENSRDDFKIHRMATAKDSTSLEDAWKHIVRRYTCRHLTVESDKLPAIGGLAARVFFEQGFNNNPGYEYLAGLWRKNLLSDLAWEVFPGHVKRSTPTSYTAPTWSWASVNEPVALQGDQDAQSLTVVKDAKVNLENSESPFGKVTGGWVHLSGIKLYPCEVDDMYGYLHFSDGNASFRVSAHMDSTRFDMPEVRLADYVDKKSELVVVPLSSNVEVFKPDYDTDDPVPGAHFLLLIAFGKGPIEGLPCFRRVGLGRSSRLGHHIEDVDGRRWLLDRCMEAMEQGNLEDIIIV